MNTFKKITPGYALQVVAVMLLFAYKGQPPETEPGALLPHKVSLPAVKKQPLMKTARDSAITGEVNSLSVLYIGLQNIPQLLQKKAAR